MRAFSLVELSIVLVILGLLTGGILAGQSLIRAAELRSVAAQTQRYLTVVYSFRGKYQALPGDMINATAFWGAADNDAALCKTINALTHSDPRATCNGNGSGKIRDSGSWGDEGFRFWQQLANAGLVEGSYSGIADAGNGLDATPGFNVPAGKIANSGFSVFYQYNPSPQCVILNCDALAHQKNLIFFGAERLGNTSGPIMTPAEAWNFDSKVDDGSPARGRVLTDGATSTTLPGCATSDDPAVAQYALGSADKLCAFVIVPGF